MPAKLALATLATLVVLLGGCGGEEAVTNVRVCSESAFDPQRGQCTRDESARLLVAETVFCSADIAGRPGELPTAILRFDGAEFAGLRGPAGSRGAWLVAHGYGADLPGGAWECEFALGSDGAGVAFRSGGSRERIQALAACEEHERVSAVTAWVCREDRSRFPLREPVMCSALVTGERGERAQIDLLDAGGESLRQHEEALRRPVGPIGALFDELGEGEYSCRFQLAGSSSTLRFSVSGSSKPVVREGGRYRSRDLPRKTWRQAESLLEPFLVEVAHELTGLEIEVRCWSQADWLVLTEDIVGAAGFVNLPDGEIHLAPDVCGDLATLSYTKRQPWAGEEKLFLAGAVGVLAHETAHFGRAGSNEGVAECYGLQRIARTAQLLGATASYGASLALLYWRELYPKNPPEYRARGCRPGGSLDLEPDRAGWP